MQAHYRTDAKGRRFCLTDRNFRLPTGLYIWGTVIADPPNVPELPDDSTLQGNYDFVWAQYPTLTAPFGETIGSAPLYHLSAVGPVPPPRSPIDLPPPTGPVLPPPPIFKPPILVSGGGGPVSAPPPVSGPGGGGGGYVPPPSQTGGSVGVWKPFPIAAPGPTPQPIHPVTGIVLPKPPTPTPVPPPTLPHPIDPGGPPTPKPPTPTPIPKPPTPVPPTPIPQPGCPPCDGGGGSGGGGGGGSGGGVPTPAPPTPKDLCRKHDGTIIDRSTGNEVPFGSGSGTGAPIGAASQGELLGPYQSPSDIPYCDDLPVKCPPPPPPPACDDCVSRGLKYIANALEDLYSKLQSQAKFACTDLDQCIDYLVDKLKDKILPPAKTCDECCQRIKIGLASSAECAATFASCACAKCDGECCNPDGTPAKDGEYCGNCGKMPCECKGGKCQPKEDEGFTAWCNGKTGEIKVLKNSESSPGTDWTAVAGGETESGTRTNAEGLCEAKPKPDKPPQSPPIGYPTHRGSDCPWETLIVPAYANSYLQSITPNLAAINSEAIGKRILDSTSSLLDHVPVLGPFTAGMIATLVSPATLSADLGAALTTVLPCNAPGFIHGFALYAVAGMIEKMTGVDYKPYMLDVEYNMNALCRNRLLTPELAINCWIGNSLDDNGLDAHAAAAAWCKDSVDRLKYAQRTKPGPGELAVMRMRELITVPQFDTSMRELGFIEPEVRERMYGITQVIPTLSDIIPMMIRDADNEAIVKRFGFNDRFDDKFGPQLKAWSEQQNIPLDVVKMFYRSHWDIPSPQALFTMYQRLRHDDVPADARVTFDDINAGLVHNNIAPFWFPKYLSIAFNPMGRIDIRRAFNVGALNAKEMRRRYQEIGYADDTCDKLVQFTQALKLDQGKNLPIVRLWTNGTIDGADLKARLKTRGFENDEIETILHDAELKFIASPAVQQFVAGNLTQALLRAELSNRGVSVKGIDAIIAQSAHRIKRHPILDKYKAGTVSRDKAQQLLSAYGVPGAQADTMLELVDDKLNADSFATCSKGIRRKFVLGEIDRDKALSELSGVGFDRTRAVMLVKRWGCEVGARGKHPTIDKLSSWLCSGSIDSVEMRKRLLTLGYDEPDVNRYVADALQACSTKQQREADKQAALREKDEKARWKATEAQLKSARQGAAALAKYRLGQAKLRAQRQKLLMSATEKYAVKCGCLPSEASDTVWATKVGLIEEYQLTEDEALKVLILSAEAWGGFDATEWDKLVIAQAQQIQRDSSNREDASLPIPT